MPLKVKATLQGIETKKTTHVIFLKKGGGNCASRANQGITPNIISAPTSPPLSLYKPLILGLDWPAKKLTLCLTLKYKKLK